MFKKIIYIIIFISGLFLGFFTNYSRSKGGEVNKETRLVVIKTHNRQPFSDENFKSYLKQLNIKYPDIVYAQAVLETGWFKSKAFKVNNNLFGFIQPKSRPNTALEIKGNYAYYSHWKESVVDYALFQNAYLIDKNRTDYLNYLEKHYAEDKEYVKKILQIANTYFNEN